MPRRRRGANAVYRLFSMAPTAPPLARRRREARPAVKLRESRHTPAIPGVCFGAHPGRKTAAVGDVQKPGAPEDAGRISGAFTPKRRCAKYVWPSDIKPV